MGNSDTNNDLGCATDRKSKLKLFKLERIFKTLNHRYHFKNPKLQDFYQARQITFRGILGSFERYHVFAWKLKRTYQLWNH